MIAAEVLEGNNTYWFRSVTFSPDGRQLSSSSDRTIRIWDAETGVLQKTLDGHTGLVGSVTFSPDGRQLVSARSEEHTSELQSHSDLVCRLLLEKKNLRACNRTH